MADYITAEKNNSKGWIIGSIVVVLVLLYIIVAGGTAPISGDPQNVPVGETAPTIIPLPAPTATE